MKKFLSGTAGKVTIITVVLLLVLCIFLAKTSQEEKAADIEPAQAVQEWTEDGLPVFIDFTADWCPYCKEMEPVLEELKQQYDGKITFATVNIDRQKKIAQEFGISSVPLYVMLDAQGTPLTYYPGAATKEALVSFIEEALLTGSGDVA
ncbi:thioredoxin family protein [Christensenella tenuis]|jgi:thioredoxin 1|uniref:Thioredoxin n=1 Tax=Christensenella tenuis TaxID=2763033 RepID=A0ABR7EKB7_9FIRM|nr:thioredoxin family protein [Christensenella tenuis]MBC5649449.1 thioredoxin family protein [Christensenella tenuis]